MLGQGALLDGRYRLEARIGAGGTGEVWRARHVSLNTLVAVKLLHLDAVGREAARKRFVQEAQVTAQLKSRHAVRVQDYGVTDDGLPYLVMEYLAGETLKARLERLGRLSPRETLRLLRLAARALARAHKLGIVHRDFKPDNIFVVPDEEGGENVKVVDFGIAKLLGGLDDPDAAPESRRELERQVFTTFTRTGGLLGTPYYMAPEQVQSAPSLGAEADVWAFGVVVYECLTGKRPFDGQNAGLLFRNILEAVHTPPHDVVPSIPAAVSTWFARACAPDPGARFPDIRSAVSGLEVALGVLAIDAAALEGLDGWNDTSTGQLSLPGHARVGTTSRMQGSSSATASSSLVGLIRAPRAGRRRRRWAIGSLMLLGLLGVAFGMMLGRSRDAPLRITLQGQRAGVSAMGGAAVGRPDAPAIDSLASAGDPHPPGGAATAARDGSAVTTRPPAPSARADSDAAKPSTSTTASARVAASASAAEPALPSAPFAGKNVASPLTLPPLGL